MSTIAHEACDVYSMMGCGAAILETVGEFKSRPPSIYIPNGPATCVPGRKFHL
jgi:hypothetical protein